MQITGARIGFYIFVVLLLAAMIHSNPAMAHARWKLDSITPPRSNDTGLKQKPCGNIARTQNPAIFKAGQTIEVEWEETVNHEGHFRIAFSPEGDLYFDDYVLLDNIPDTTNKGFYSRQIKLPDNIINCTDCTLQLEQIMTTLPNPGDGDFYYSCSDIEITTADDATPPSSVANLQASGADRQIQLSWSNPNSDFYRVVVLQNTTPILDSLVNDMEYATGDLVNGSQVVYVGKAENFNANSLINGTDYYFKVFTQNPRKNFDSGVSSSSTPMPGSEPEPNPSSNTSNSDSKQDGGGALMVFSLAILFAARIRRRYESL